MFKLPLLAAPFWIAGTQKCSAMETGSTTGLLSWEQFVEETSIAVEGLYGDSSPAGQDAYLHRIASNAVRLGEKPSSEMISIAGAENYRFGMAHMGSPFFVVHWTMEPNSIYPAHNHPDYSVCTLGLDGDVLIENYEVSEQAPVFNSGSSEYFDIRHTKTELIERGDIDSLSATRNNIHYLRTGARGAEGVDITTAYTSDTAFSFLRFDDDAHVGTGEVRQARWVGQNAADAAPTS